MAVTKDNIKRAYEAARSKKARVRRIESQEERCVHFLFDPQVPQKISPFTRKYKRLLEGTLQQLEEQENEKFTTYMRNLENENLGEDEKYPIVYEDMPWFTCELTGLSRLSFAVADDPFFRTAKPRFYPMMLLIDSKSHIKTVVSP